MNKKQMLAAACALLLMLSITGCSKKKKPASASPTVDTSADMELVIPDYEGLGELDMDEVRTEIDSQQVEDFVDSPDASLYVKLSVKDYGDIVVRLRPEAAPITVANFQALVARGYFNGTTFHRVYPGFMIQGGEGQDAIHPIKGEFAENGVKNPLLHIRGVLSMARTTEYDSATSQFFLMHADNSSLDGGYAAFGYVVAGMDTVDLICKVDRKEDPYSGERTVPLEDVVIECADFVQPA